LADKPLSMLQHSAHATLISGSFTRAPAVLFAAVCAALVVAIAKLRSSSRSAARVAASSTPAAGVLFEYGSTAL
jgi:hypothetical protein